MPSRPSSRRDVSNRASDIQAELEQLLSLESSENGEILGTEALNDKRRKSKKLEYNRQPQDRSDETNDDDARSKKSVRSKRGSKVSKGRSSKDPAPEGSPKKRSKSPKPGRSKRSKSPKPGRSSSKDKRKIKYRTEGPETAEERDRDARSHRSKDSRNSRGIRKLRKASNGVAEKPDNKDGETTGRRNSALLRSKRAQSYRTRGKSSDDSTEDKSSVEDREKDGRRNSALLRSKRAQSYRTRGTSFDGSTEDKSSVEKSSVEEKDGETNNRRNSALSRAKRAMSYRKRGKSPGKNKDKETTDDNKEKSSRRTSKLKRSSSLKETKGSRRRSWSFDDFGNTENWSSSEEMKDVEVSLNDEGVMGEFGLNDVDKNRDDPRQHRVPIQTERRRSKRDSLKRSSSTGGLVTKGVSASPGRRKKTLSSAAIDVDMVLGDPSRSAPTRSKSNDIFLSASVSRVRDRKGMTRSESTEFADYLRKQGMPPKFDRSMNRKKNVSDHGSLGSGKTSKGSRGSKGSKGSKGNEETSNPFEVTYQSNEQWDPFQSGATGEEKPEDNPRRNSDWDPFVSEEQKIEEIKERRGNLRPTRSSGFLKTSSKDTISRLRTGANVRKACDIVNLGDVTGIGPTSIKPSSNGDLRRAEYKKSIAAAAMAGRRLSSNNPRPPQRHARTVRSSFEETRKQLEGALQRAR